MQNKEDRKKPELLVPAGSPDVLRTAVHYGADAVYIGGEAFGLRAKAKNFSREEMKAAIDWTHEQGKKVFVTVNILAHNADLPGIREYLEELHIMRPDGLIIADPGVFSMAGRICPEIPRHISTQANNTNAETCRFWAEQGASRIVTARELSLQEIRELREQIPEALELECFVHGAMCISYSGRCLLSCFLTGRDANRGACTHPCRWKYSLVEETRPGEYFPVFENERGTFLFNSKDLCMIGHIPELCEAGIDSFKIEGRMKTALYVATVTRAYRLAIDDWMADPDLYEKKRAWYQEEVSRGTNRKFTTGFFFGKPSAEDHIYEQSTYVTTSVYLGTVRGIDAVSRVILEQKNKFSVGDRIELLKADGRTQELLVRGIYDKDGVPQPDAPHARQELHVELEAADGTGIPEPEPFDVLRSEGV